MSATSATVLVISLKVTFQKFPDHNHVKISSQQLRSNISNSILKDIRQMKILRTWIKILIRSSRL